MNQNNLLSGVSSPEVLTVSPVGRRKIPKIILVLVAIVLLSAVIFPAWYLLVGKFQGKFTQTSEISPGPTPGSCIILEQKYCSSGKVVEWNGNYLIAFKLPPNAFVFSPFEGSLSTTGVNPINPEARAPSVIESSTGELTGKEERGFVAVGDLSINGRGLVEPRAAKGGMVGKGDVIAVTGNTDVRVFENYNLVLVLNRFNKDLNKPVTNEELIKQLFPYATLTP